jgi:hypothetical protein
LEAKTVYEKGATMQPQVVILVGNGGTKISLASGDVLIGSTNDGSPLSIGSTNDGSPLSLVTSTSYPIGSTNLTLDYLNTLCFFSAKCKYPILSMCYFKLIPKTLLKMKIVLTKANPK